MNTTGCFHVQDIQWLPIISHGPTKGLSPVGCLQSLALFMKRQNEQSNTVRIYYLPVIVVFFSNARVWHQNKVMVSFIPLDLGAVAAL